MVGGFPSRHSGRQSSSSKFGFAQSGQVAKSHLEPGMNTPWGEGLACKVPGNFVPGFTSDNYLTTVRTRSPEWCLSTRDIFLQV